MVETNENETENVGKEVENQEAEHRKTPTSVSGKQSTTRASIEGTSFKIVTSPLNEHHLESSKTPIVKLVRVDSQKSSPARVINAALAPNEMDLISSSLTTTVSSESIPSPAFEPLSGYSSSSNSPIKNSSLENAASTPPPKISREYRLLLQDNSSSKVLQNFIETGDTPRRRKQTHQINPAAATASIEIESEAELTVDTDLMIGTFDSIIPLKMSPQSSQDSDSTIVLQNNDQQKRRKSISRSRSRPRSRLSEGRKKSVYQQMTVELAVASDREEVDENNEDIDDVLYPTKTFENRAPNPPPKPGWDSFCFKCHADNAVLSLACSKCKCSYHRACVRPNPIPKNADEFICPQCRDLEIAKESPLNKFGHPKIDQFQMKEMLMTILETIRGQPEKEFFENEIPFKISKDNTQPLIVTQMSYKIIEERIMSFYYKTTEAFIHDIKQLEHNWILVDKSKIKALKTILKYIEGDINEMESCIHCYASAFVVGNWFSAACKRPHLLVWAKLKGYPYWPAKVMSIDVEKQQADVRFFGAHDRAYIPSQHCIIFCEKDPNKSGKGTPTNNKKGIVEALKETEEYISNIRATYGFDYSTTRETLDTKNYQAQLEKQLPKLKLIGNREQTNMDKETDVSQKEKLTLKIIRTTDGNQKKVEHRVSNSKQPENRHPLYRVLSKTNISSNESETQSKAINPIILRRDESVPGKSSKKSRLDDTASETSESNVSTTGSVRSSSRRKSARDPAIKRVPQEKSEEQPLVKKVCKIDESEDPHTLLLDEVPAPKPARRSRPRSRSVHEKNILIVSANSSNIPAGTDEIHALRDDDSSSAKNHTKVRSRSLHRLGSQEIDGEKKKQRRLSAHVLTPQEPARRLSVTSTSSKRSRKKSIDKTIKRRKSSTAIREFPAITVKSEPISDTEEVIERDQITVNDIQNLVGRGRSKTIVLLTSESEDSYQGMRARKSFPNSASNSRPTSTQSAHAQQIRNQNAMICIPQEFSRIQNGNQPIVNGGLSNRTTSVSSSPYEIMPSEAASVSRLPALVPKPAGVFSGDDSNFQIETGAVSALFSENAHRMTDYFKSLLIDTIGAVSSGIPSAEITLLRMETEKLKLQIQKMKNENLQTVDRLKKEHMEEIRVLRQAYDDKRKKYEENAQLDLARARLEIRKACEIEKQMAIDALKRDVKKTTWCSQCLKEARFYCCWNTSYCGTVCQREHWSNHQINCRNLNTSTSNREKQKRIAANHVNPVSATPMIQIVPSVSTSMANTPITSVTLAANIQRTPVNHIEKRLPPPQNYQLMPPKISTISTTPTTIIKHIMPHYQIIHQQIPTNQPPPLVATSVKNTVNSDQVQPIFVHNIHRVNSPPINVISPVNVPVTNLLANNPSMPSLNSNICVVATTSAEQTK